MRDEERELVRNLQARADAMRDQPIELILANEPGPYRLPKCQHAAVIVRNAHTAELLLDTQSGQRILVEIDIEAFRALHGSMSFVLDECWTTT